MSTAACDLYLTADCGVFYAFLAGHFAANGQLIQFSKCTPQEGGGVSRSFSSPIFAFGAEKGRRAAFSLKIRSPQGSEKCIKLPILSNPV